MLVRISTRVGVMMAVFAVVALGPVAPAHAAPSGDEITPVMECAADTGNGWVTVWGYTSRVTVTREYSVGVSNNFSPDPQDRGQPTTFDPGTHHSVVVVPWDGSSTLHWHVDKDNAYAARTPTCDANALPATGSGVQPIVAVCVLSALCLGGTAAFGLLRRRRARQTA